METFWLLDRGDMHNNHQQQQQQNSQGPMYDTFVNEQQN
jgi:hypothetical protein